MVVSEASHRPVGYVGLISRVVAFVIDLVVVNLIAAVVGAMINLLASLLGHGSGLSTTEAVIGAVAWWMWFVAYFVTFWALTGQTPGDRLLGMRVESVDGSGLGMLQSLRRFVGAVLAMIPLGAGFLLILFDDRRRGLQDLIGGTVVRWVPEAVTEFPPPRVARPVHRAQPELGSAVVLPPPRHEPELGRGTAPGTTP
jgi:uncharacterized RDD family membrane protein YckC